ncbi:hypothetical protein HN789_00680 [archaeon]|jgi:hypothetical protein|nr:hypothetical protein [archaeon]MBT4022043.1 hypothetical protein [archaeon]MBT4272656.1 hypothetical protein [archaeon]MBT4461454.1 hypothetical protein [archaeon]MBT4857776.1 hypothetical protein [archaeon]
MIREEVNTVIKGKSFEYEGYFSYSDLIILVDSFFKKNGYTKTILNHSELVKENGKEIKLRMRPSKNKKGSKLEVQVWLTIKKMVNVVKKVDGLNININKGKISIVVDAYFISDVRGKWEAKPEYTFIKTIFEKFLFSGKSKDYAGWVTKDANDFIDEIRSHLNLHKYVF